MTGVPPGELPLPTSMCRVICMATNLAIDDQLLEDARRIAGLRTKKDTVTQALKEFIEGRKQARVLELFNTVRYDPKYDYKKQRRRT